MNTELSKLYYDPTKGFISENKLYIKAKEQGIKVTHKIVNEFLKNQFTSQVNRIDNKPKQFTSIYEDKIRDNYQMDIIIYDRYTHNHYKYILVIVDIYSRYAMAKPMTNRRNETIMSNIKDVINIMGKCKKFSCDNEFKTKEFEKYCIDNNIEVSFSEPNDIQKNSIVERLNRTIALMLQKYRTATNDYNWVKILPDIMNNYNNTIHRTIKNTPDNIFNHKGSNKQDIIIVPHNLKIGDKVRLKIIKNIFSKGDSLSYSNEEYLITEKNGNKYKLSNGKLYSYDKIRKISDIIEYKPNDNIDIQTHLTTQKDRVINKKLKQVGMDKNNIIITKRIIKKKVK